MGAEAMGNVLGKAFDGAVKMLVVAAIGAVLIVLTAVWCTTRGVFAGEEVRRDAIAAAEALSFSDVEVTDARRFFVGFSGCGMTDAVMYSVTATTPGEKETTPLTVCCGLVWTSCSVRAHSP